ncbi:alpha/beta fold hydrolase [Cryobacterium sp. HLT2-28]|uniref:alpha/beta fold hydrolase n=1 Tax=Cryobacterium sp. HLT2-28 TaxID=1259146 RepID=UPI00106A44FA|nr:alpha/beta hydrolase [Cryobacterium sp. HLT2-28]TFB94539.1 alpha/beta hydrolase [Cryobacterium sp. HLT2-28]
MVAGEPKRTDLWFARRGTGETLVLLHPGGADSRVFDPLITELDDTYVCFTPDHRAHGRTGDVAGPLSFEAMAADTIAFLERSVDTPVHLLGYSDGAIVALYVALARPDLVRTLVFIAAVFHREGWLPGVLDGEAPDSMGDSYGEVSPDGREHWPVVVAKLDHLHAVSPALTVEDLATVTMPTLVILGDDDEVRFEHAVAMYRALPDGELAVAPRSTHGLVVEKPALIAWLIRDFHDTPRTNGFAPIRRA